MYYDNFKRPVFGESDIIEILYEKKLNCLDDILVTSSEDIEKFNSLTDKQLKIHSDSTLTQEEFDLENQKKWFMPKEYQEMDIEGYLVHVCPKENYNRLIEELQAFREKKLLDLLRWLKYFVDTAKKNNVVWGVGRGSSVSSYVLYLIGVHRIDSVKYNLSWQEFLR